MSLIIADGRMHFYQWDTGQQLEVIHEEDCEEVHFCHNGDEAALVCPIREEEGKRVADVPNILLQRAGTLMAYLSEETETGVRICQANSFCVKPRPKPEDYIYTETEVINYNSLSDRLEKLEGEGISQAVEAYLKENPVQAGATAEEAEQIRQNKENIEKLSTEKLDASKLPEAVSDALAQAKASGEFKGDPGAPGEKGETGDTGATGAAGPQGPKGDPYRLTEADKAEIVTRVIESLGGNPVFGYVDENNNIVVQGNLADGAYSVKYEMEDGSTVDIGNLVLDSNVYYTVTNNLTNCTSSNTAAEAIGGESYSAVISANSGYELSSVVVTMGGNPVTVSGGNISIAEVTGDIVITAVAEEVKVAEPVTTNIALTDGIRIGSDGTDRTMAGHCATEYIDLTNIPKPCTIHLTKAKWAFGTASESGTIMYYAWKADDSKLAGGYTNDAIGSGYFALVRNDGKNTDVTVTVTSDEVAKIRFSGTWSSGEVRDDYGFSDWDTVMHAEATLTYTPAS